MFSTDERVLVVDDDRGLRNLIALICRRVGFHVDTAKDGAEALRMIGEHQYLLVTLDLQMPNVNGFDVVTALRALARRPAIVVITAMPPSTYVGLDASVVQAIVRKPFDVDLLSSMIAELAANTRAEWQATDNDSENNIINFRH